MGGAKILELDSPLGTDLESGLSNPQKRCFYFFFLSFVLEASKDLTMRMLFCTLPLQGFGPKEWWYDGASIIIFIFLVIFVTALVNFKRAQQAVKLGESNDIKLQVLIRDDEICGRGRMVVGSLGQMMSSVGPDFCNKTPIQGQLDKLNSSVIKQALLFASLAVVGRLILYFMGHTKDDDGDKEFNGRKTETKEILIQVRYIVYAAVSVVVGALPAGLPLTMSLTLAYSMNKMRSAKAAMVRKLSGYGPMGSATIIFSGKTGTVTLNEMEVAEIWLGKQKVVENPNDLADDFIDLLQEAAGLSTAKTDSDLGMKWNALKKGFEVLHDEFFNLEKRSEPAMVRRNDNSLQVHRKGAARIILATCSSYYDQRGILVSMDDEDRGWFKEVIQSMAKKGLRCIAFAHKQVRAEDRDDDKKFDDESEMGLLGIVGLKDPGHHGVQKAAKFCREAGVDVRMVTEDDIDTAKEIAIKSGILKKDESHDESVMEGIDFRNYSQEERMEKIDRIKVVAGSSPNDKVLMVQCLKEKGHAVAFIGDDANDGDAAFKAANIGLSVGSKVAKESSDIVITDGSLESVITALKCGRQMHNNIQEFVQCQLTVNAVALVVNSVAFISAGDLPLTAIELLWVNLIITTLGALRTMATDQPSTTDDGTKRAPDGTTLMTKGMWKDLIRQILIMVTLMFKGTSNFHMSDGVLNTMLFNLFVLLQVLNQVHAWWVKQKEDIFEGNRRGIWFLGGIGMTILLQVAIVQLEFAGIDRLNLDLWFACIMTAASPWVPSAIYQLLD